MKEVYCHDYDGELIIIYHRGGCICSTVVLFSPQFI
jgi:hypothetical protein